MTNAMIIFTESVKLLEEGTIKGTGRTMVVEDANGNKRTIEEPETIHTFATWKKLGYVVKRGQKAVAKFPIWNYSSKKIKNEDDEDVEMPGKMYLRNASFFTSSQVEKVGA